jgi:competence ComEA-like helix-hairpin-helix protein
MSPGRKRRKISASWKEYFNFSARERRGAFLLSALILCQVVSLLYLHSRTIPVTPPDERIVQALGRANASSSHDTKPEPRVPEGDRQVTFFPFDPNTLNDSAALLLGLSLKQMKVIRNYLSRGGKYRTRGDFKKMYCISESQYLALEPFIRLPDSLVKTEAKRESRAERHEIVNMATADSSAWMKLRGIGPVFASRIVRYREKLGGFYALEQLKEVWGITDSLYECLLPSLVLEDTVPFRYIRLNADSFAQLASHPYIKGKLAGLICNYRKQHGSFSTGEELKQLPLVNGENFRKIAPYIRLD